MFLKYADVTDKALAFRLTIPMLKISEMYYIAAECEPDATQAVAYLNTVRNARGLLSLPSTISLNTELQKEYQKEFYGEGQLFYYYKRNNTARIPNGAAASGDVNMSAATYVLPLPLSETQYRQ
ncbi:SusD family protein [compost metagenome]